MNKVMTNGFCELNENEMTTVGGGVNLGMCVQGIRQVTYGYAVGAAGAFTAIATRNPSISISSTAAAKNMINTGRAMIAVGLII